MGRNVMILGPSGSEVVGLVKRAVTAADATVMSLRKPRDPGDTVLEVIARAVKGADVAVFVHAPGVWHSDALMVMIGAVQALNLPIVIIATSDSKTSFQTLVGVQALVLDAFDSEDAFLQELASILRHVLADPDGFAKSSRARRKAAKTFISYCHVDRQYLERLLVHLRPLEKQGLIDRWDDTRIHAGDLWKTDIEAALDQASIAVLLVSADFLASDFIDDNELPPLLKKAESKGVRILSVVLKPCRFLRDERLSRFQAVHDAEPLIGLSEAEQEAVYDEVAEEVERAVGAR